MADMVDLETMSRADLMKLRSDVDRAIAGVADREKRAAMKAAEAAARDHGFSLADLMDAQRPGRARRAAGGAKSQGANAPKYRNPDNADQTWSGRGRRPGWIHEQEQKGVALDQMAI